jgi:hypothetical protein
MRTSSSGDAQGHTQSSSSIVDPFNVNVREPGFKRSFNQVPDFGRGRGRGRAGGGARTSSRRGGTDHERVYREYLKSKENAVFQHNHPR